MADGGALPGIGMSNQCPHEEDCVECGRESASTQPFGPRFPWCHVLQCDEQHEPWYLCVECCHLGRTTAGRPLSTRMTTERQVSKHHNNHHTAARIAAKRAKREAADADADADAADADDAAGMDDADAAGGGMSDAFTSFRKFYNLPPHITPSVDAPFKYEGSSGIASEIFYGRERDRPGGGWKAIVSQSVFHGNPLVDVSLLEQEIHLLFTQLCFELPETYRGRLARLTSALQMHLRSYLEPPLDAARAAMRVCLCLGEEDTAVRN